MSAEDLEKYETDMELALYREYRDVLPMFRYVIETDRRSYLCNTYELKTHGSDEKTWFELILKDAWVWDVFRPARFVSEARVNTFRDINIEEVSQALEKHPLEQL